MNTAYVDIVEAGKAFVTLTTGEGGTVLRSGSSYTVEDEHGTYLGRAKTYRAGALRVAEHHGVTVDRVELEPEWKTYK